MRVTELGWWVMCMLVLVHQSSGQDDGAAVAAAGSTDPDAPNFDIGAALAELKSRSVRLRSSPTVSTRSPD
jgi:hypothetical protein